MAKGGEIGVYDSGFDGVEVDERVRRSIVGIWKQLRGELSPELVDGGGLRCITERLQTLFWFDRRWIKSMWNDAKC